MVLRSINFKKFFTLRNFKENLVRSTPSTKYDMRIVEHKYKERDCATLWKFRSEEDLDGWYTLDDNMTGGRSLIELSTSRGGRLHMKGTIDPTVSYFNKHARPWDGTGYAGIRSYPFKRLWGNIEYGDRMIDLYNFHQFEFRVRGDGRCYRVQLWFKAPKGDEVMQGSRIWVAHLQTRGGPYWERVKIPFNRFYPIKHEQVTRILHKPAMMNLHTMGIFTDNQQPGDFSLEIDSIRGLNTFVDDDCLYAPEKVWKYTFNKSINTNEELIGKYRKSRVYSKHDHILT